MPPAIVNTAHRLLEKVASLRWVREFRSPTSFVGNVLLLAGWTAAAQALYVVTLPLLSRLYAVEIFGNLAVLGSVSTFTAVISALRYEVAILLPEDDQTAMNLLVLSMAAVTATTLCIILVCLAVPSEWIFRGPTAFFLSVWWLVPLAHFGIGAREAFSSWAIRRRAYPVIARTKVAQVTSQLTVQLGLGLAGIGPLGLYGGDVVGRVAGAGTLATQAWVQDRHLLAGVSLKRVVAAARHYRSFPLFSIWAQILSRAGRDFIPVALAALYGPTSAGWYSLAARLISAPLELVARAVSQVYMGEASTLARVDPVALRALFVKWARRLTLLAMVPSAVLAILGPPLFRLVFGAPWEGAGVYARCMAIMLLVQFSQFSLGHTLTILERQSWQLLWDAAVLVAGLGGIVLLHTLGASDVQAIGYYSVVMAVFFCGHYLLTLVAIGRRVAAHTSEPRSRET